MGNCCHENDQLPLYRQMSLDLQYDAENIMIIASYNILPNHIFEKTLYNWHSVPIITEFPRDIEFSIPNKSVFQVRNKGIHKNNFLVGVIKKIAIANRTQKPWETDACLCFQSYQTEEGSSIIYNNRIISKINGCVSEGDTIKVGIENNIIDFSINGKFIYKTTLPRDFLVDFIVPYVALFSQGDKVQFIDGIKPEPN